MTNRRNFVLHLAIVCLVTSAGAQSQPSPQSKTPPKRDRPPPGRASQAASRPATTASAPEVSTAPSTERKTIEFPYSTLDWETPAEGSEILEKVKEEQKKLHLGGWIMITPGQGGILKTTKVYTVKRGSIIPGMKGPTTSGRIKWELQQGRTGLVQSFSSLPGYTIWSINAQPLIEVGTIIEVVESKLGDLEFGPGTLTLFENKIVWQGN